MRYGDSLSLLSLASLHSGGDFPIQSSTWQWRSRSGQPAQAACLNIRAHGACAVCLCVLYRVDHRNPDGFYKATHNFRT